MARHGLSLIDIEKAFGTEEQCLAFIELMRWPDGVDCLKCGSNKVSKFVTNETTRERKNRKGEIKEVKVPARHLYQCNNEGCRFQFSATAGTIFDKTHLPLTTWFKAIGLLCDAKKGISAMQMERHLGVNYRTAWHLNHRIREAMDSPEGLFSGTVEVDATFVGGKYDPRRKRAPYDKQAVAGIVQRRTEDSHSMVRAFPVKREIAEIMGEVVRDNVAPNANLMTDEHRAYSALGRDGWKHEIVAHSKEEWVRGLIHTQGVESFWSLLKRQIIGQHHWVSVKHLDRYIREVSFKFNHRESVDVFAIVVANLLIGEALRYRALTGPRN